MAKHWTRRQVLAQIGIAAAAVHTLDPHELCCAVPAHAKTTDKDLFELKKVADGVYAAVAAATYKVNSNAAVIVTDDGVVVVRLALEAVGRAGGLHGDPGDHEQADPQDRQHALPLGPLAGERGLCGGESWPRDRRVPADAGEPDTAGRGRRRYPLHREAADCRSLGN